MSEEQTGWVGLSLGDEINTINVSVAMLKEVVQSG